MMAQAASISARVGSIQVPKLASLLSDERKRDLAAKFESPHGRSARSQAQAPSSDPRLSQGTLHVEFTGADVNDLCASYLRYKHTHKGSRAPAGMPANFDGHAGDDAPPLSLAQSNADLIVVASMGTTAGHILPGLFDSSDFLASSRDAAEALGAGGADAFLPASIAAQTTYEHLLRTGASSLIRDQVQQHLEEDQVSDQKRFWGVGSDDGASHASSPQQEGDGLSMPRANAHSPGVGDLYAKPPIELTDVLKHNTAVFSAPGFVGLHKRSAARVAQRQARLVNGEESMDKGIHGMTAGGYQVPHELPSGRLADVWVSNVYHGTRSPYWRWAAAMPVYECTPDTVMHISVLRITDAISTSATNQESSLDDFLQRIHLVGACVFPLGTVLGGGVSALAHHGNVLANPMQTAKNMEANADDWQAALSGQPFQSQDINPRAVALATSMLMRPLTPLASAFAYWNQLWTTSLTHTSLPVHLAPTVNSMVFNGSVFDFPAGPAGAMCPQAVMAAVMEGTPIQLLRNNHSDMHAVESSSNKAPPKATVDEALVAQVLCMLLRSGHIQVLPPAPVTASRTLSSGMPTPRNGRPTVSQHVAQRPRAVEMSPGVILGETRPDFAIASLQLHAAVSDLAPASVGSIKRELPRALQARLQQRDALLVVSFPPAEAAEQMQQQLLSIANPLTVALAKTEIRNSASSGALPLAEAAGIAVDALYMRDISAATAPLSPANSVHSRHSQQRATKQDLTPLNATASPDKAAPVPLPSARTWTNAVGGQQITRQHDWLRDKEHGHIVQQPFHGIPAYALSIRWRYEVDEDPAAVRGARLLQRIGVSHGDPLSSLKVQPLRLLAHAAEASKSTEISRHLPVLEPLFRHVTEELERRQHADWGVMAEASSQLYASVLRQDAMGSIPRVVSTPASARRTGSAAYTVRGGGLSTAGYEFDGGARETGRRPSRQTAVQHVPMTPKSRMESASSTDALAIAPAHYGTLQLLLPGGAMHACVLSSGGSRRHATRTDDDPSWKATASSRSDGTSSISGIRKFEFVGLMRQLTEQNTETLNNVFDHMDSNNDDDLSFDEFISYLLAEADTALAHRLSQDCYLLAPPAVRDTKNCVRVDNGGAQSMEKMPEMQGYAVLFNDNQMQVWDDSFSLALQVDVRGSTCPLPPAYCLPLTEIPAHTGLMVSFDKTTGKLQTVRQAEGVSSSGVQRGGASQRDTLDAQDRFRSDLRAQRSVMGVVIDAGSVDTRGRYRRSSMSGQYLRDALASAGGRAALTAPIRPGTADAGQLSSLRSTVPAHLFNTYYKPAHQQGQSWMSPLGFTAAEAFANPVTVDAASRIVARGQHSSSDARQQAKQMLAFMSNASGPIVAARPQTAATALKKNRKGGAGMGKLRGRLHLMSGAAEDESKHGSQSAGGVTFSAATEDVLANMTPPITAVVFDGTGGRRVLLVACADRMVRVFDLGKYRSDGPLPLREVVRRRRQAANKKKSLRAKVRAGMGADTVNIKASSLAALPGMEDILNRAAVRAQTGKDASQEDVRAAAMARAATVAAAITSTAPGVQPSDDLVARLLGGNPEAYLTTPTSRLRHAAAMVEPMASLQRTEALVSVVFGGSRLQDVARREALMGSADPARSLIPLPGASNATIGTVPRQLYHHNPYMGARLRRRAARRKQQTALQEASSAAAAAANTLQEASPLSAPVSIRTGAGLHGALGAEEAARTASMHLKSAAAAELTHARSHKGATIISNAHMSTSSMLDGGRETAISALAATYVTGGLMNSAMGGPDNFLANAGGMSASALAITNAIQREQQAARQGAGRGAQLSGSAMTLLASGRNKGDKLKSGFIGVGTELSQGLSANVVLSSDLRSGGTLKDGSAATSGAITMPVIGGTEAGVSTLTCFSSFGVGPGIPQCLCVLQCVPYITEADHGDGAGATDGADLGQRSGARGEDTVPVWQSANASSQDRDTGTPKGGKRARKGGFGHVVQDGVPTGTLYAVGDSAGFVGLYSTKTFVRVALIATTLESVTCLLQAPGVGLLAAGLGGPMCVIDVLAGEVRDWDGKPSESTASGGRNSSRINAPADRCMSVGIRSMSWCDTERCIISVGHDRRVLVWDPDLLETGPAAEIGSVPHSVSPADTVVSVTVNDAHRQIVTLTAGGRVQVWDPRTLRCLQSESDAVGRSHTGLRSQAQEALSSVQDMALGTTMGDIMGGDITGNNTALGQSMSGEVSSAANAGITHATNGDVSIGTSAVAKIAAATAGGADAKNGPGSYLLRGAYDPGTGGGYFGSGIMVDLLRLSVIVYGSHARAWKVVEVDGNETPAAVAAARFFGLQDEAGEAMSGDTDSSKRGTHAAMMEHSSSTSSTLAGRVLPDGSVRLTTSSGLHEADLGMALADSLGGPGSAHLGEGATDENAAVNSKVLANVRAERKAAEDRVTNGYDAEDIWMAVLYAKRFNLVVAVKSNGRVVVWDVRSGTVQLTFRAHHGRVAKDATRLISKTDANGLGGSADLSAASLDAAGRRLVTASITGTVRLWNITNGALVRSLVPHNHELSCVAFHPAPSVSSPIVAGAWNGTLLWWVDDGSLNEDVSSDDEAGTSGAGQGGSLSRWSAGEAGAGPRAGGRRKKINKYLRYRNENEDEDAAVDALTAATMARIPGHAGVGADVDAALDMAANAGVAGADTMRPDPAKLKSSLKKHQLRSEGTSEELKELLGKAAAVGEQAAGGKNKSKNTTMNREAKLMLAYFKGSGASPSTFATGGSSMQAAGGEHATSLSTSKALTQVGRRSNTEALQAAASVSQRMRTSLLLTLSSHERKRRVDRARSDAPPGFDAGEGEGDLLKAGSTQAAKLRQQIKYNNIIAPGRSALLTKHAQSGSVGTHEGVNTGPRITQVPMRTSGLQGEDASSQHRESSLDEIGGLSDPQAAGTHSVSFALSEAASAVSLGLTEGGAGSGSITNSHSSSLERSRVGCKPHKPLEKAGFKLPGDSEAGAYSSADILCVSVGGGGSGLDGLSAVDAASDAGPAWVATGSADGHLVIWNPNTFKPSLTHKLCDLSPLGAPEPSPITSLLPLVHMNAIVVGTASGCLHLLNLASGRMRNKPRPAGATPESTKRRVTITEDGRVQVIAAKKEAPMTSFHTTPLTDEWDSGVSVFSQTAAQRVDTKHSGSVGAAASSAQRGFHAVRAISSLACVQSAEGKAVLAVGYDGGHMRLYDISRIQTDPLKALTQPFKEWKPHVHSVTSVTSIQPSGVPPLLLSAGALNVKLHRVDGSLLTSFSSDSGQGRGGASGTPSRWPRVLRESDTAAQEIASAVRRLGMLGGEAAQGVSTGAAKEKRTTKQAASTKVRLLTGAVRRMSMTAMPAMSGDAVGSSPTLGVGKVPSLDLSSLTSAQSAASPASSKQDRTDLAKWFEQKVDDDVKGLSGRRSSGSPLDASPIRASGTTSPAQQRGSPRNGTFVFDRSLLQSRRHWTREQARAAASGKAAQRGEETDKKQDPRGDKNGPDAAFWDRIHEMESEMVIPPPSRPRTVTQGLLSDRFDVDTLSTAKTDSKEVWSEAMQGTGIDSGSLATVRPTAGDSVLFDPSIDMVGASAQLKGLQPQQRLPLPNLQDLSSSLGVPLLEERGGGSTSARAATPQMRQAAPPSSKRRGRSASGARSANRASSKPAPRKPSGHASARAAGSTRQRLAPVRPSTAAGEIGEQTRPDVPVTVSHAAWAGLQRQPLDQPAELTPGFGDSTDNIAYDGEFVSSVTNFSQWSGQPGAPIVPKHARIPYEYLGKGRWRRLPINSARNTEGWGALRSQLQNQERMRAELGMRRK